jgi:ubiquinone/menaquinone biosynthesis C-methylase UbiE
MYRRRVELCLAECTGGQRVLEVGFGSGLTFLNLCSLYQEIHGLDLAADTDDIMSRFRERGINTFLRNGDVLRMPYPDHFFDSVLLISILEHLRPTELLSACLEVRRVLKPGGQMVYGAPIERPFMVCMFKLLGYDIRKHHYSTHDDIFNAASQVLQLMKHVSMRSIPRCFGAVYEVGHFAKCA